MVQSHLRDGKRFPKRGPLPVSKASGDLPSWQFRPARTLGRSHGAAAIYVRAPRSLATFSAASRSSSPTVPA